jgi:hypothetical protein
LATRPPVQKRKKSYDLSSVVPVEAPCKTASPTRQPLKKNIFGVKSAEADALHSVFTPSAERVFERQFEMSLYAHTLSRSFLKAPIHMMSIVSGFFQFHVVIYDLYGNVG